MNTQNLAGAKRRIVVLGGGFGGAYAAQTLRRSTKPEDVEVVLLDRNNYMLFYPLLVEAGVGEIEPRHVVVPLRKFVPGGQFLMAEVESIDLHRQQVSYRVIGSSEPHQLHYDHLVFAMGSVTRFVDNIPGLREYAYQLKSLVDAVALRDRAIRLLELANTLNSERERRDLLRIVVVGANFTGVEIAGEYHAFLQAASKEYPNVEEDEIEMVVVEHGPRILNAVPEKLANWAERTLTARGVEVRTRSTLIEVGEDYCVLLGGERLATRTVIWAAGIAPNPLIARTEGLPTNEKGYIAAETDLRVRGFANVWALGDSATVYDEAGKPYAATAQIASRQGPHVAKNIVRALAGDPLVPFSFRTLGSFAAIGRRQAAAEVMGRSITGLLGWLLYRGAYLTKLPGFSLRARVALDWLLEIVAPSPVVQLGVHRLRLAPKETGDEKSLATPGAGGRFRLLR
jgi:NADH dehydrogenase